jgi:Complex 1 protein (LYR family)
VAATYSKNVSKCLAKMASRLKDTLPFHIFIRRGKVLQMYKDFRRATRKVADKDLRIDLKNQVFSEFKSHKNKEDNAAIKLLLGEGTRNLARLRSMSDVEEVSGSNDEQYGRVGAGWPWSR